MKGFDPISVIEAAYRVDTPQRVWLEEIAASAEAAAGAQQGALTFLYDATKDDWVDVLDVALHRMDPAFAKEFLDVPVELGDREQFVQIFRRLALGKLRGAGLPAQISERMASTLERFGIGDVLCVNATDPTARGCVIAIPTRRGALPARTAHLWRRLATHVAAGARLRRTLAEREPKRADPTESAEAIIAGDSGRIEHAVGPATERDALDALRAGLAAIMAARGRDLAPERAVAVWEALIAGRWSIIEHFERDGKRYYLAHRNDPELGPSRGLTARERQVLVFAERGHSNKLIAYALGLSISTVSTLLTRARRKLRSPNATEN